MRRSRSALLVLHLALACDESGARPDAAATPAANTTSPPAPANSVADAPVASQPPSPPNPVADVPTPKPPEVERAVADVPMPDLDRPGDRQPQILPEVELTAADVLAALDRVVKEGKDPSPGFSWHFRAADLLERDAKLRQTIVDRLREPTCPHAAREFGVSILVTRAHPDLQAALRQVLTDPVVRADPSSWMLVTRLGNVPGPDDETIELAFTLRASDESLLHHVATLALGGQVSALLERRPADAAKLTARLEATLKAEPDPARQALLVEALGVGGHSRSRGVVRGYARSESPELRRAAARGMLRDESRQATTLLLDLVVDPDLDVQAAAIDALVDRPLDAAQQRSLHAATISGRIKPRSDHMLTILVSRRLVGADRKAALELLLARNTKDDFVRRDINAALASE